MKKIFLGAALALAASFAAAEVVIDHAWVRATVPGQKTTGAFMHIHVDHDMQLVDAVSPAAGTVELHGTQTAGGIAKMRPVTTLPLVGGKTVELKPGGYHFMLVDLKQQVKVGDPVPLTLVFLDAAKQRVSVNVAAQVQPIGSMGAGPDGSSVHRSH